MKRIFLLCGLLTAFFLSYAAPIKFLKSIPENGSTIDSFDFSLVFDISEALDIAATEKPGVAVGLGYMGADDCKATLYRGNIENGTVLGETNTSNFTGKTDGFKVNGNTIQMNFDGSIPIVPNEEYTIVINNTFYLYVSGKVTKVALTESDFSTDPIILKFKGEGGEKTILDCTGSSIETNATLNALNKIEFTLNSPFNINTGAEVVIKEGDNVVASTSDLKVSSTDNKVLVAEFSDVPLLLGHSYTIELPANSLTHIDDATVGNFVYKVNVNGSYTYKIALTSSKVDVDSNGIPTAVTFVYDLPEGTTLNGISMNGARNGFLSVDGSEELIDFSDKVSCVENGKGLKWSLSSVRMEPATKYNFTKAGNTVVVFDAKNAHSSTGLLKEYAGEDASISFTTPSVEEIGAAPITVGIAKIGNYDDASSPEFVNGGTYANISSLEIKRAEYVYNGNTYKPNLNYDSEYNPDNALIYDISDGTRKLVKEAKLSMAGRGGDHDGGIVIYDYSVFHINVNMDFLQEHTYEIVIPKGALRLSNNPELRNLYNYIMNDEIVYTVKGTTPTVFTVDGCSVENNAEMSALPPAIVWTLNGAYELKNSSVLANGKSTCTSPSGGFYGATYKLPVTIQKNGYKSYVAVHLIEPETGESRAIHEGEIVTITIPAGSIVYPGDESLANPELTVSVKGIAAVAPKPETVNVNLTINDLHSASHKAVKGETYSFAVKPNNNNWEVEFVKHGDKALIQDENGMYVTEPLNADAEIKANLKYAGTWAKEDSTTDVWTIEENNICIYCDNNMIAVDGVTPENTINVYNVAGMFINSTRVSDGRDRVYISVPLNQTYIVSVDGV
ncbi:MAG: hypothetical protein K2K29_01580, partial [Muribaculaceae bacterium]|nr:hypothetical protein [Muribaculaceae bacterium]